MRTFLVVYTIFFLSILSAQAQLESSYLESIRKSPKSMTLDILKQKKEGDNFKTTKHTRYELNLYGSTIVSQKVYDTMSNIAYNKSLLYVYDKSIDNNLAEIVQTDFEGTPMKRIKYTYDDRALLLLKEEHFDGADEFLQSITHNFGGCDDAAMLEGLPTNINYTCSIKEFTNRVSTRKSAEVYGDMGMLVKKINYKSDGTFSNTEVSEYNDDWKLKQQEKKTSSGRGYKTLYTYNEQGDVASKKANFVEFYYAYEYDEKGNWTQMIETTKVPTKRVVYTRTFIY